MLEVEGVDHALPGMTFNGALRTLQEIYPKDKESLGVYVFELKFKTDEKPSREFYKVSDLLKAGENKKFARIIAEAYMVTDWICKDYPDHCDHFFGKYIPGTFDGEREIITCYIDNKIAAVAILNALHGSKQLAQSLQSLTTNWISLLKLSKNMVGLRRKFLPTVITMTTLANMFSTANLSTKSALFEGAFLLSLKHLQANTNNSIFCLFFRSIEFTKHIE